MNEDVKTSNFEALVHDTKNEIIAAVNQVGIYRKSTMDMWAYGWNADKHQALHTLYRRGIEGLNISWNIRFQVTDWVVTKN